jgi:hypothetical protein
MNNNDGSIFGLAVSQQNKSKSAYKGMSQNSKYTKGREEYIYDRKRKLMDSFHLADGNQDGILSVSELQVFLD